MIPWCFTPRTTALAYTTFKQHLPVLCSASTYPFRNETNILTLHVKANVPFTTYR